jgi:hypothetical protein
VRPGRAVWAGRISLSLQVLRCVYYCYPIEPPKEAHRFCDFFGLFFCPGPRQNFAQKNNPEKWRGHKGRASRRNTVRGDTFVRGCRWTEWLPRPADRQQKNGRGLDCLKKGINIRRCVAGIFPGTRVGLALSGVLPSCARSPLAVTCQVGSGPVVATWRRARVTPVVVPMDKDFHPVPRRTVGWASSVTAAASSGRRSRHVRFHACRRMDHPL